MANVNRRQYFLVQVARPGSKNILNHGKYHYDRLPFMEKDRDYAMVKNDDLFVVYFAGRAIRFRKQLRMVYRVRDTDAGNHDWFLEEVKELRPISYAEVRSKVRAGELGKVFDNCGQQGFNIKAIREEDYRTVLSVADR